MTIPDPLFSQYELRAVIEAQGDLINKEIDGMDSERLLNTNPDELTTYIGEKYLMNVPVLNEEMIQVDQTAKQVDVSRDPNRFIRDRSQPFYLEGTEITYFVPYEGDGDLFKCRPSTFSFNPPRVRIQKNEVLFVYTITDHDLEGVKSLFQRDFKSVQDWLSWIEKDVKTFNSQINGRVADRINARREKLLKDQGLVADLGFPLRRRRGTSQTYIVPSVKRKVMPTMPIPGRTPYVPEPIIAMEEYEHILSIISNMVSVMERSPGAFKNMGEEDLRQHFLVQLNGQYEGQATGETFNSQGKTDILIRVKDRNIFIAECKFWHGPEEFKKAIDQLLSYATWRDGKIALLIFNRDIALSTILERIPETVKSHSNFIRQEEYESHTAFRFVMKHGDDSQRELIMTVMVFEVPAKSR